MAPFIPHSVHLVGSSPFNTNTEFFERMLTAFPNRLPQLPDGEVGKRNYFVRWQFDVFADSPHILKSFQEIGDYQFHETGTTLTDNIKITPSGLRNEGMIQQGVRFQVSLPTPVNVIGLCLRSEYQARQTLFVFSYPFENQMYSAVWATTESMYEKALLAGLRRIQDTIPADDLAIQWDTAYEIGMLELPVAFTSWFDVPIMQGILERVERLAEAVDEGVKIGFHLCYGDAGHKHFVEPKDMGVLVGMMNKLAATVTRSIGWFHVPVPRDRTDEAYFLPLKDLKLNNETVIHLGLAHAWDLNGTRKRIEVASGFLKEFGVATECGFGRTGEDEVENVLGVLAAVTEPQ